MHLLFVFSRGWSNRTLRQLQLVQFRWFYESRMCATFRLLLSDVFGIPQPATPFDGIHEFQCMDGQLVRRTVKTYDGPFE